MTGRGLATTLVTLLAAGPLWAQGATGPPPAWILDGSLRVRVETIDNTFRPGLAEHDRLLSLRTTLFAEYARAPWRWGGELFDSRAYGQQERSAAGTSEVNALELAQLYAAYTPGHGWAGLHESRLTAGRFTMDVGSRRLVARNRFRNTTNAFTGLRFDGEIGADRSLTLFWTMPHTRLPSDRLGIEHNGVEWDRESPDLQFFGGSWTRPGLGGGSAELYAYGLLERDADGHPTRNRRLWTPGLRLYRTSRIGQTDYDLEFAWQTGQARASSADSDTRDLDVSAYFLHAEVGHCLPASASPRGALFLDVASGDGRSPHTYKRFDTLFGARRSEYGPTSLYGAIARANLLSPGLRLDLRPDARWDGFVAWRALWLEDRHDGFSGTGVRDASGASGRFAGHQFELNVRHWLSAETLRLDAGVAVLARGPFLKDAPNANGYGDTTYAYLDATYSFR
ncbi:alginate export family protein [Fontimonas sp. SYSU GA230001]|uniref:alginate export family protein n=1 Tax=Fontimonas sp. SYSU GA230001 TaxID=3142450 RepID=UPI0032B3600D